MSDRSDQSPSHVISKARELVNRISAAERDLERVLGPGTDVVLDELGKPHLLRQAQEALLSSEECFRETFEQAAVGIAHVSIEGHLLRVNSRFRDIVGIDRNAIVGTSFVERLSPEDEADERRARRAMLAGEISSFATERPYRWPDGRVVWAHVVSALEKTSTGEPKYFTSVYQDITQRKLTEENLQRSQVMMGMAGRLGHLGAWSVELPGMQVTLSDEVCAIHGMPNGFAPSVEDAIQFYAPECRGAITGAFYDCVHKGTPFDVELQFITAEGRRVWVRSIGEAERDQNGEIRRIHGAFQDISDQKEAETLAIRLATLVEFSDDAIVGQDLQGIISSWNNGAERTFGFSADEIVGRSNMRFIPSDRINEEIKMLSRLRKGEAAERFETQRLTKDGRLIDVAVTASPIKNPDGSVVGVVKVVRDITDRRKIEGDLLRRQSELGALFDLVPALIWFKDTENRILRVNQRAAAAAGIPVAEIEGKFTHEIYPLEADKYYLDDQEVIKAGEPKLGIVEALRDPDGNAIWVQTDKVPMRDKDGNVVGIVVMARDITERKRIEESLQENERRFREMYSATAAGIAVSEPHGRFLRANPAYCAMLGYTETELLTRDFASITHPDDLALNLKSRDELLAGQRDSFVMEKRYIRKNGEPLWTRVSVSAARSSDGAITSLIVVAEDITERKRNESRFRRLVDSNIQSVFFWNNRGEITGGNDAFLTLVRYAREDLEAGRINWKDMTPPEYAQRDQQALAEIAATGACSTYRKEWIRKDGSRVPILIGAAEFEDSPGNGVCFVLDLTKEIESELALRESEKRFKALFEQAAVGVAQIDAATGLYLHTNRRFCEIVGRSQDELALLTASEIDHEDAPFSELGTLRSVKTGASREYVFEKHYQRKNDSDIWASVTVSEMWAPGERPDFYVAIVQDITSRKQLEEQFRQAQKMEAMGTLAGGIAHDFNNILTAIIGFTQLAQMKLEGNPEVVDFLSSVLKAGKRAAELVKQILTFSRHQAPQRQVIQLTTVVAECLKLLRATTPATIEIDISLATDAPSVLADASQVHQIILNLGTNALHAMNGLHGRLQVTLDRCIVDAAHAALQSRLRPGVYARVSVADTGCGMDKATMQRIFEPFFTTKPPGEGTGLGLSVVHGIMESHDGAVIVYSQPGEGTVFHLYFPAHSAEETIETDDAPPVVRGRGERILFVDDEELLVQLGQKMLSGLGYEVEAVRQPEAALELFRMEPSRFALVITDHTMPGMTGLVLASRIRQVRPDMPVILMTGFNGTLTPERLSAERIRQMLLKPTTIHALSNAVHKALSADPQTKNG
jgi:PAS domain S-box-containing protein